MKHIYLPGKDAEAPTFVLLHGTGGTEKDLVGIANRISPSSAVLGIRGNVLENGMTRFFRRLSEGVFDEQDLVFRTKELYDYLDEAAALYKFDRRNLFAVGYSNGANIAASLLFHYKDAVRGAILHHPMVPLRSMTLPDLSELPVFIGAGRNDRLCPPEETEELAAILTEAGAAVTVHWESHGHQLTNSEMNAAAEWYEGITR